MIRTLFIDRDGVINHEKENDYIHKWDEFKFYDGVLEAFNILNKLFDYIIVVTNQKGVGKGVTKIENLYQIHKNMKAQIINNGGKIDAIYFCPDIDTNSPYRKPNAGMGHLAKNDFPKIQFENSMMIGNTISDMEFGKNLGVSNNYFLTTTRPEVNVLQPLIDNHFDSLINCVKFLQTQLPEINK